MKISYGINDLVAGVLSGLLMIIIATGFTALIFKGSLASYFSIGMTCAMIGSCIINLFTASFSSFRFGIARAEPAIGAIFAIIFTSIAAYNLSSEVLLPTLIATIGLVSLLVGIVMFLMGIFELGQIARFLPFPVLGGIIAGIALIMAKSSIILLVNDDFSFNHLTQSQTIAQYCTGIGFAFLLLFILRKNARPWLLPILVVVLSVIINVVLYLHSESHAEAIQNGWLFLSFKPELFLKSVNFTTLQQIDWLIIFYQMKYLASLIAVIIIFSLLNVSGLEAIVREKADLDQELKTAGFANIVSGLALGITANLSVSGTILNKTVGARNRISGWVASVTCLMVLFIFPELISYLPKPIIGGLLLYIGFKLLIEWLYEGWKTLPFIDYLIVLVILITIAISGFLDGILVGILITCIVLAIRYARIDAVKFATSGKSYHSNVNRPLYQQKWQAQMGNCIQIFKLQGYLFFGSAKFLLDKISRLIELDKKQDIRFLIFDFQLVSGIDSSAIYNFIRLQQLIEKTKIQIIFTNCSKKIIPLLRQQGIIDGKYRVLLFANLDEAMEWCENEILKLMPESLSKQYISIDNTLAQLIPDEKKRDIFEKYLEKINVPANTFLFKQGDVVDCLYFIESGEVTIFIETNQSEIRVSKSGPGTIVGEIGFYLERPRSATVRAETDCVVYKLTKLSLLKLEKEYPDIALIFHRELVHVLAIRVIQTNEILVTSQF